VSRYQRDGRYALNANERVKREEEILKEME
jgi:hypothetical protein